MARPFLTTRWSVVLAARNQGTEASRTAFATLCSLYWEPLYGFLRRDGFAPQDAEDITQEFLVRLLEGKGLSGLEEGRGRFRSYLLGALRHYLADRRDRECARKRGGGRRLDWVRGDEAECALASLPSEGLTPDQVYDRRWADLLLTRALKRLRDEYEKSAATFLFEALRPLLTGEGMDRAYADIARELGMTIGAVKVAAHRLRKRFRDAVRTEVADTVQATDQIDAEIRSLYQAMG